MRILLAEDDLLLGDGIRAGLRLEGDTVEWVTDGVAAENALVTDESRPAGARHRTAAPQRPGHPA